MINDKTDINFLIVGFLTNTLDKNDLEKLNHWLDEDITHCEEFNKLRSAWILSGYEIGKKSFDAQLGWSAIKQNINIGKTKWIRRFSPLWYAASLLFCFVLGSVISAIVVWKEPVQQKILSTSTTISVPLGAKSNITLPDGSMVWLNAGSVITYSSNFGLGTRDLQLTGEAFFDVKSDSLTPFNVHTSDMTVKALGTRFNVKAYPDDNTIVATLEEGIIDVMIRVSGKTESRPINLKPKEQLVVIRKAQFEEDQINDKERVFQNQSLQFENEILTIEELTIRANVNTELSTSWKDEKWIIDNQQLDLFVADLERRYNLDIIFVSNELKDYKFSGTIENQTAEQIFKALSLAAPVNYKFDKNKVVLSLNAIDKDKFIKILKK